MSPYAAFLTESALASAFTEWERRFREEPDRFESEAKRLLTSTPETYGEACAPYLLKILDEQSQDGARAKLDACCASQEAPTPTLTLRVNTAHDEYWWTGEDVLAYISEGPNGTTVLTVEVDGGTVAEFAEWLSWVRE